MLQFRDNPKLSSDLKDTALLYTEGDKSFVAKTLLPINTMWESTHACIIDPSTKHSQ